MILQELQDDVHNKLLDLRRLERALETPQFEDAFDLANQKEFARLKEIIEAGDPDAVRSWIRLVSIRDLDAMTFTDIRRAAKYAGVPYYSRMARQELTIELRDRGYGQTDTD